MLTSGFGFITLLLSFAAGDATGFGASLGDLVGVCRHCYDILPRATATPFLFEGAGTRRCRAEGDVRGCGLNFPKADIIF